MEKTKTTNGSVAKNTGTKMYGRTERERKTPWHNHHNDYLTIYPAPMKENHLPKVTMKKTTHLTA